MDTFSLLQKYFAFGRIAADALFEPQRSTSNGVKVLPSRLHPRPTLFCDRPTQTTHDRASSERRIAQPGVLSSPMWMRRFPCFVRSGTARELTVRQRPGVLEPLGHRKIEMGFARVRRTR